MYLDVVELPTDEEIQLLSSFELEVIKTSKRKVVSSFDSNFDKLSKEVEEKEAEFEEATKNLENFTKKVKSSVQKEAIVQKLGKSPDDVEETHKIMNALKKSKEISKQNLVWIKWKVTMHKNDNFKMIEYKECINYMAFFNRIENEETNNALI